MESKIASKVLCREIGRLVGPIIGLGARWAARKLPNIEYEENIKIAKKQEYVLRALREILERMGTEVPEFPNSKSNSTITVLVGSGLQNLNPTLVRVQVRGINSETDLILYAVAKEGKINQHSAASAIGRIRDAVVAEST